MCVKGVSALGESADSNEVIIDMRTPSVPASPNTRSDGDQDGGPGNGNNQSGKFAEGSCLRNALHATAVYLI